MAAEYSIMPDGRRRFVGIVFRGFWTLETVESYRRDRMAMARALAVAGTPLATCTMLVDARLLQAQPLDSVAAFGRLIGGADDAPARSALLVASALFARQGQRMAIPNQRLFTDKDEALAWLAEVDAAVVSQPVAADVT